MSHDTWFHRAVTPAVAPLARTPLTPNHLTTLRLAAGLAAAAAVAVGDPRWLYIGAGVFLVGMLLDRADGILARLTDRHSAFGHKFDLVADALSNALIFVGLGIGLRHGALSGWAIPLGVLAGGAVVAVLWLVVLAESRHGARKIETRSVAGFDADDAMLAVPLAIWLGWSSGLLYAAAIGAPVFAIIFFWKNMRYAREVA